MYDQEFALEILTQIYESTQTIKKIIDDIWLGGMSWTEGTYLRVMAH